jgi:UDP-N-acetylmuramyl tripeptide synthase
MSGVMENVTHLKNENTKRELEEKYKIIEDRRKAINYAINQANKYINTLPLDMIKTANIMPQKPIVIISGKGTDPYIMRTNGKREKWSDAKVAKEELGKVLLS